MEAVEAEGAVGGAGLPAGGDVDPAGFFSLTRFSGSLKPPFKILSIQDLVDWIIMRKTDADVSRVRPHPVSQ